jgi:hypothetical protein
MNQPELFVHMAVSAWETQNKRLDKFLDSLIPAIICWGT